MKLGIYKQEKLITDFFTEKQILQLHASCDCYVSTSYGEAVGLGARDALGMGNAVIAPRWGGFLEYLNEDNSWLIDGRMEPVFGQINTFPDLNTSRENWFSIDQLRLQAAMRACYENKKLRDEKRKKGMEDIKNFSYDIIGQQMKTLLSD